MLVIALKPIDLTYTLYDGLKMLAVHPRVVISSFITREISAARYKEPCKGVATKQLIISDHSGTHVDAPKHFIPGGTFDNVWVEGSRGDRKDKEEEENIVGCWWREGAW